MYSEVGRPVVQDVNAGDDDVPAVTPAVVDELAAALVILFSRVLFSVAVFVFCGGWFTPLDGLTLRLGIGRHGFIVVDGLILMLDIGIPAR